MEHRNVIKFDFIRRQSETSLHCLERDQNSNVKNHVRNPVQRSATFTPHDLSRTPGISQRVTLPERFRRKIRRNNSNTSTTSPSVSNSLDNIDEEADYENNLDWEDRKREMERALKWVTQELLNIREQDRVLVKRFLDLHADIQHTRGIRSCPSLATRSTSSLSASSWLSLDDGSLSAPGDTPVHQRDILQDLQHRSIVNLGHLVLRQSSLDSGTSKHHLLNDVHGRTVSLMDVNVSNARSSIDECCFDTLLKYADVLTESEDESNYDTLTKYPDSQEEKMNDVNHYNHINSKRKPDNHIGSDSNYDILIKCSDNQAKRSENKAGSSKNKAGSAKEDTGSEDDESNYDTLTKYPRAKRHIKESILTSDFMKDKDKNHSNSLKDNSSNVKDNSSDVKDNSNDFKDDSSEVKDSSSDFDTDSLELYLGEDDFCEEFSCDTRL